jgi:hypothetical protein
MNRILLCTIAVVVTGVSPALSQVTIERREAPLVIERGPGNVDNAELGATGSLSLTPDQEVVVRRYIVEERVVPAPTQTVRVGSVIPPSVQLYDVEDDLSLEVPMLRSYSYFRAADNRIVFVEPSTRRVVRILQ